MLRQGLLKILWKVQAMKIVTVKLQLKRKELQDAGERKPPQKHWKVKEKKAK
jgi:hypothetical protein